ncbi:MAG: multidrug ABC transporter ATP-binding protein [Gammaproteobacteria bacterium]|nr:ABC transporter ATP-binding protein/permease [SAR86 cluster bacterium]GIT60400.1 MAG: multidrug ABC transporter ATP-binding protein [Gammaproteobacteria bacterium]
MSKEASLPFAGIPPEMLDKTNALIDKEPDFSDIEVAFSHKSPSSSPFTLWSFLAPYKFRFIFALVLVAMTEMLLLVGPYLVQVAIDKAIVPKDFSVLITVAMVWGGSLFLAVIISGIRIRFLGRLGQLLMYDLRVRVFSHLQRLSVDFFTEEKAGRLLTRMTSDIEALSNLLQTGLVNLVAQLLALFFILILLFSFNLQLTLILLVFSAPVMFGFTFWFSRTSEKGYEVVRNRIADVLADLQESLSGMRLVISFNRMKHNVINHRNVVGDYRDANNYTSKIQATYRSGTQFITTGTSLLIFTAGFFILKDVNPSLNPEGAFTVGSLVAFNVLVGRFFIPINELSGLYNEFQSGNAAVKKLADLLGTEPSVKESENAFNLKELKGDIRFNDVSFSYEDDLTVLNNISLHIEAGKTISFVGPTGAGKSTIAKLICRFYDPTRGSITLDNINLKDISLQSLHRQLGIVPQEPFLFHGTIKENILFARPDATDEEVVEACKAVGIEDMIKRLPEGLETHCHERGSSLSSGERQLLALARAFLSKPRVLILDEATSNIDQQNEARIEKALDKLLEGRTAIIIAHRLATTRRADVIVVVDEQKIVEMGSHEELIQKKGSYFQMYETWERQEEEKREEIL